MAHRRGHRPEPQAKTPATRLLEAAQDPQAATVGWIRALRGKDLHNAALVALDYRTGDVLAYVGSAGYYRDRPRQPQVRAEVRRRRRRLPPARLGLEADPLREPRSTPGRSPRAASCSTSRPSSTAARTGHRATPTSSSAARSSSARRSSTRSTSRRSGPSSGSAARPSRTGPRRWASASQGGSEALPPGRPRRRARHGRGPAARPDLGLRRRIANGGVHVPPRMILEVRGPDGQVVCKAPEPEARRRRCQPAGRVPRHRHPRRATPTRKQNPIWASRARDPQRAGRQAPPGRGQDRHRERRPRPRDVRLPRAAEGPGRSRPSRSGIWMGNSDHSQPARRAKPAISLTAAAPLWHAFVARRTRRSGRSPGFPRPSERRHGDDRRVVGRQAGPVDPGHAQGVVHRRDAARRRSTPIDQAGLLYSAACGGWRVDPVKAELGPGRWDADVADWLRPRPARPRRRPGRFDSRTAYFWGERSWGGTIVGPCAEAEAQAERRGHAADGSARPGRRAARPAAVAAGDPRPDSEAHAVIR